MQPGAGWGGAGERASAGDPGTRRWGTGELHLHASSLSAWVSPRYPAPRFFLAGAALSPRLLMRFATGVPCLGCLHSPPGEGGEENCTELRGSASPTLPRYPELCVAKSAGSVR